MGFDEQHDPHIVRFLLQKGVLKFARLNKRPNNDRDHADGTKRAVFCDVKAFYHHNQ